MNCEVCCETFNKSTHSPVNCPYCSFKSCTTCTERYLCETTEDSHCMSCRKAWSREILVLNFTQKFVSKTYKARRENLLFEREKSLMPATLPYVEINKKIRKILHEVSHLKVERDKIYRNWSILANQDPAVVAIQKNLSSEFEAEIEIHRQVVDVNKEHSSINIEISHLEWTQVRLSERMLGTHIDHERRQFVRACPWENCRGFLSTAWKCGVCENWTCPECHEVKGKEKDAEHVCDPNNVATARLLAKDSRNCPKCASLIFKINGCDQMYCTQCHTAFSWRTGRTETGTIHNPHYYDYMRAHGTLPRNPGDFQCGGLPDWRLVRALMVITLASRNREIDIIITNAHRLWGHVQHVLIPRYITHQDRDNRDLRINFMLWDISEEEFKKKIQQREKARHRKTDIRQVLEMFSTVIVDLFQTMMHDNQVDAMYNSLMELRIHVNKTLVQVSKRYGNCATPVITENYDMY